MRNVGPTLALAMLLGLAFAPPVLALETSRPISRNGWAFRRTRRIGTAGAATATLPPIGSNGVGEPTAMIATMTTTAAGAIDRLIATIIDKSRASIPACCIFCIRPD